MVGRLTNTVFLHFNDQMFADVTRGLFLVRIKQNLNMDVSLNWVKSFNNVYVIRA